MGQSVKNFNSVENVKKNDLVDSMVKNELMSSVGKDAESFYDIKGDVVEFKKDILELYLNKLKDELKDKDIKEAWEYLISKDGSVAWIMAVQIILESIGIEVGKIDGIFGDNTKEGVRKFQAANGLKPDGYPGKNTLDKLFEALNGNFGDYDKKDKEYSLFNLDKKTLKSYTINSISELPEGYKWKDPENYDVNNEDTYPISYYLKIGDDEYRFYSNGRCSFNKRMYNTKDVIEKMDKK